MNSAQGLTAALAKVNNEAIARWIAPDATGMAMVAREIEQISAVSAKRSQSESFDKRLITAIARYRDNPDVDWDYRTLRLVCHGCSYKISTDDYVPLADKRALATLLVSVASYAHQPRRFRRLYHGLLQAYLTAERQAD